MLILFFYFYALDVLCLFLGDTLIRIKFTGAVLWIRDILVRIRIQIRSTDLRIRVLLFSSVADKMPKFKVQSFLRITF
jgi:hypothetical protein